MTETPSSWLRIALEVDPELAEAVSEVLARYLPGGIAIESTAVTANAEDEGHPVGPLRVLGYIPQDADTEETRTQIEQGLRYLALIQPLPEPSYEVIHEQNWMESWKQHYRPLAIGQRLLILPAWVEEAPAERVVVRIEPGMAFGTGVHPTTQLSLELLEAHLRPGDGLIDIGCGSAILAIAGAKLGAAPVVAVDYDDSTMDNARHNIALNETEMELGVGSVAEVLAGGYALQQAEVVVANILAPVLVRLLGEGLGRLVKPGGTLVLSGILNEQEADLRAALAAAGLAIVEERRSGDWLGLAARPA